MRVWNVRALKDELVLGDLPGHQAFQYLLATNILAGLAAFPMGGGFWEEMAFWITFVITILGTGYCHVRNGGAAGEHLLARFLSLSWVLLVRLVVFAAIPSFVLFVVLAVTGLDSDDAGACMLTWTTAIALVFYWRLGSHISDVARRRCDAMASRFPTGAEVLTPGRLGGSSV